MKAADRGRILSWYLPALAGTLLPLGAGFYASAEANRIVYAALGLAAALASIAALRLLAARRGGVSEARAHAGGRR